MAGKKRGVFSTMIAFFLGIGVTVGAQSLSGSMTALPSPSHVQSFAATAPPAVNANAGSVSTASSGTQNAPLAPISGSILTTEQITNQVGPAVVTVINRQKFSGSRRVAEIPGAPGTGGGAIPGASSSSNNSAANSSIPVDAGLGSGVIYDAQGYLITNNHVVEGANAIDLVLADGTRLDAILVGRDPSIDIAVVKIDPTKVPAVATLGDSDKIKPGQRVIAIGSPEALENTVTEGIISGTNRTIQADPTTSFVGLIQTDAAINHGNSGGPLLDTGGVVIGINTLGIRDEQAEGLNFAIPINRVRQAAQTIVTKGGGSVVITRAYLGVNFVALDKVKAQQYGTKVTDGAYITDIDSGSPAEKAGLKKGDVITAVNGTKLDARTMLGDILSTAKPGDKAAFTVDRSGTNVSVTATLVERPLP